MLDQLGFFAKQIAKLDARIRELFKSIDSPIKDIPGIGEKTAPMILAELGEFSRFKGGYKKLLAYCGPDPRVRQSGQWKGTVKMNKRGSPALRTALFQAASMAGFTTRACGRSMHATAMKKENTTALPSAMSPASSSS